MPGSRVRIVVKKGEHAAYRLLCVLLLLLGASACRAAQQPLTCDSAIRIGLTRSPAAHAADDALGVQRAMLRQARMYPNPRLYVQSEDLRPWDDNFNFGNNTEDYGYLSQTLELDGKRGKRVATAKAAIDAGQQTRTGALRQLAAGIADACWTAVAARTAAGDWDRQLQAFDRIVQYQSSRVQAGAAAGVDLLRFQLERDRVAVSTAQAHTAAVTAAEELARQMGWPEAATAVLADTVETPHPVPPVDPQTAIARRPDILAARAAVQQAEAEVKVQRANGVPDLDILGGYKRDVGANTAYGGLQIDLPFWNRNQGGVADAQARLTLARDALQSATVNAQAQIAAAAGVYKEQDSLVRNILPGALARAERNLSIIQDAYRSGGTDLLRYLDAERSLVDTRLMAAQTWAEYQRAAVALRLAYGEEP